MKFKRHIIMLCTLWILGVLAYIIVSLFRTAIILSFNIQVVRILQTVVITELALSSVYGVYVLVLWSMSFRQRREAGKQTKMEIAELQSDPLKLLINEIHEYLRDNKSTAFFKEKLEAVSAQLPQIAEQVENVKKVAAKRFEAGTLSYSNNVRPIEILFSNLIKLSNDLLMKLQMFDENKYQSKISELKSANRLDDLAEYQEVMQHYTDYANDIISSFEKTSIKLDMLILEFAKLSGEELQRSIESLKALDSVIVNTKLYK